MNSIPVEAKVLEKIILLLNKVDIKDDELLEEIEKMRRKVALWKALFEEE